MSNHESAESDRRRLEKAAGIKQQLPDRLKGHSLESYLSHNIPEEYREELWDFVSAWVAAKELEAEKLGYARGLLKGRADMRAHYDGLHVESLKEKP